MRRQKLILTIMESRTTKEEEELNRYAEALELAKREKEYEPEAASGWNKGTGW